VTPSRPPYELFCIVLVRARNRRYAYKISSLSSAVPEICWGSKEKEIEMAWYVNLTLETYTNRSTVQWYFNSENHLSFRFSFSKLEPIIFYISFSFSYKNITATVHTLIHLFEAVSITLDNLVAFVPSVAALAGFLQNRNFATLPYFHRGKMSQILIPFVFEAPSFRLG